MKSKFLLLLTIFVLTIGLMLPGGAFSEGGIPDTGITTDIIEPEAILNGPCKINKVRYMGSDTSVTTTSMALVPVPDMSTTFTAGGTTTSCLLVTYTAYVWTGADELMYVVAQLDGVNAFPGEVQFDGDSDEDSDGRWARSHAFTWVFPNVTPGIHTLKINWRSFSGGTIWTHKRSAMILHY